MNKMKEVGSVFGNVQRTSYDYMKLLDKTYKDGLNSIPFAKHMSDDNMDVKAPSCVEYKELIKTIMLEKMKRL